MLLQREKNLQGKALLGPRLGLNCFIPSSTKASTGVASSLWPFFVTKVPTVFPRTMSRIVSLRLMPLAMTTAVPPSTASTVDFSCVDAQRGEHERLIACSTGKPYLTLHPSLSHTTLPPKFDLHCMLRVVSLDKTGAWLRGVTGVDTIHI